MTSNNSRTPSTTVILLGMTAVIAVIVLIVAILWIAAHNAEVRLRARFEAQQQAVQAAFDRTWKTIQSQAEIPAAERESFRKVYTDIMASTQGVVGSGQLASFLTQAKVDISPALFSQLMTTIDSQRASLHEDQVTLLSIAAEHKKLVTSWPDSMFVGSRPPLVPKLISSAKTKAVFEADGEETLEPLFKE